MIHLKEFNFRLIYSLLYLCESQLYTKIFVQYDDILPYYLDPMFLIILVFTGYMFQKRIRIL